MRFKFGNRYRTGRVVSVNPKDNTLIVYCRYGGHYCAQLPVEVLG